MNLKRIVFLAVASASAATLTAGGCDYNYNCNNDCCGFTDGVSVYADWIYWRAGKGDLDYAIPYDDPEADGKVKEICPGWDSGLRIGFVKDCDCWGFGADYLWYRNKKSD